MATPDTLRYNRIPLADGSGAILPSPRNRQPNVIPSAAPIRAKE